jgi:hypothetical protein
VCYFQADFGFAIVANELTNSAGTTRYMSPSQLHGGRASFSWDVHALGIVFWEIWFGDGALPYSHCVDDDQRKAAILRQEFPISEQFAQSLQHAPLPCVVALLARECWGVGAFRHVEVPVSYVLSVLVAAAELFPQQFEHDPHSWLEEELELEHTRTVETPAHVDFTSLLETEFSPFERNSFVSGQMVFDAGHQLFYVAKNTLNKEDKRGGFVRSIQITKRDGTMQGFMNHSKVLYWSNIAVDADAGWLFSIGRDFNSVSLFMMNISSGTSPGDERYLGKCKLPAQFREILSNQAASTRSWSSRVAVDRRSCYCFVVTPESILVFKYSSGGGLAASVSMGGSFSALSTAQQRQPPADVLKDANAAVTDAAAGRLFVSDIGLSRISVWDSRKFQVLFTFGRAPSPGERLLLKNPHAVVLPSNGDSVFRHFAMIAIVEVDSHRLQVVREGKGAAAPAVHSSEQAASAAAAAASSVDGAAASSGASSGNLVSLLLVQEDSLRPLLLFSLDGDLLAHWYTQGEMCYAIGRHRFVFQISPHRIVTAERIARPRELFRAVLGPEGDQLDPSIRGR